jgi:hypothetical protein
LWKSFSEWLCLSPNRRHPAHKKSIAAPTEAPAVIVAPIGN